MGILLKQMVSISTKIILSFIILFFLVNETTADIHLNKDSPTCKYGVFDTWFSLDGIKWINTTVDYITLKQGQPFYIKSELYTFLDDTWVSIIFSEVGEPTIENSTFELIKGPTAFYKPFDLGKLSYKNTSLTYIWGFRIKRNTSWINGNAPLNVMAQFDRKNNGEWNREHISYTVVNAFIDGKQWINPKEDYSNNNYYSKNMIDGFQLDFLIISLLIITFIKRIF